MIVLTAIQLPFVLVQATTKGIGDPVYGTFANLGSGAHVVGALAFVAAIALSATLVRRRRMGNMWLGWLLVIAFIVTLVATDAKQVLVAAIPAALVFILLAEVGSGTRLSERRAKLRILVGAAALFAIIFATYGPLHSTREAKTT